MSGFDDDDFNDGEKSSAWTRFWNRQFDGDPLWYLAAMGAVPLYVGLLISRLDYADTVLPWVLGFMIAAGLLMLWISFYRGK